MEKLNQIQLIKSLLDRKEISEDEFNSIKNVVLTKTESSANYDGENSVQSGEYKIKNEDAYKQLDKEVRRLEGKLNNLNKNQISTFNIVAAGVRLKDTALFMFFSIIINILSVFVLFFASANAIRALQSGRMPDFEDLSGAFILGITSGVLLLIALRKLYNAGSSLKNSVPIKTKKPVIQDASFKKSEYSIVGQFEIQSYGSRVLYIIEFANGNSQELFYLKGKKLYSIYFKNENCTIEYKTIESAILVLDYYLQHSKIPVFKFE